MKRRYKFKNKKKSRPERAPKIDLSPEAKRGILAVAFFALAAISILSLFDLGGVAGGYLIKSLSLIFGWGKFFIPVILVIAGIILIKSYELKLSYVSRLLGVILLTLTVLGLLHIFTEIDNSAALAKEGGGGGYLGLIVSYPLLKILSFWGGFVVLAAGVPVSLLVMFNVSLTRLLGKKEKDDYEEDERNNKIINKEKKEKKGNHFLPPELQTKFNLKEKLGALIKGRSVELEERATGDTKEERKDPAYDFKKALAQKSVHWEAPPLNLLEKDKSSAESGNINANAEIIKKTLENFGIYVEMGGVSVGPTVTQYTLRPEGGIKLSKIAALNNDLALALAAHPIRIEAPIPGKSLVGIEIPNHKVAMVMMRSMLESDPFKHSRFPLSIALGRDVSNNPLVTGLDKMPHLLISGSTGSGKSVCINSVLISLLYTNSPDNLKLLLVDPKRVELSIYNGIPHLIAPVVVDANKTTNALKWCVSEMERRYELLSRIGTRDIVSYNSKILSGNFNSDDDDELIAIPYIVVVIDELADLMASRGKEVEATIVRLAQMARAVGIHLIVATQRPSTEVITGLIKANITSRIAFRVASQIDSRTILDMAGAEKLVGNGDMLFLDGESSKPKRLQGVFVSEEEVKNVVEHLKKNNKDEKKDDIEEDIFQSDKSSINLNGSIGDDELYEEARGVVVKAGKASASLLQRRLRVGYARAARLLDLLEDDGVIGPAEGAKPRQVFLDEGAEVDYSEEYDSGKKDDGGM